jgi:hypothetical protein
LTICSGWLTCAVFTAPLPASCITYTSRNCRLIYQPHRDVRLSCLEQTRMNILPKGTTWVLKIRLRPKRTISNYDIDRNTNTPLHVHITISLDIYIAVKNGGNIDCQATDGSQQNSRRLWTNHSRTNTRLPQSTVLAECSFTGSHHGLGAICILRKAIKRQMVSSGFVA